MATLETIKKTFKVVPSMKYRVAWAIFGIIVTAFCLYLAWLPTLIMLGLWWGENALKKYVFNEERYVSNDYSQ